MKNSTRIFVSCLCLAGSLAVVMPVKAFYFEMPKSFQNAIQALKSALPTFNTNVKAQEGEVLQPIMPAVPTPVNESQQPVQQLSPSQPTFSSIPVSENNPPLNTCRVNGVDQPGNCDQQQQKNEAQFAQPINFQPQSLDQDNQLDQDNRQKQNNERMLKDLQRGAKEIQKQLKQFDLMMLKIEKRGIPVSAETKVKVEELKVIINKSLSATTEEVINMDMNEMWDKMRDLEEERRNLEQMDNILREMKRIESSIKIFEKQVQKLVLQKLAVPVAVNESLEKLKLAIAEIKAGKLENAQDIFDLVQNLDENRQEMEMLSRWPQTVKEMDRQVKNLETQLKRAKIITDRLIKKDIDVSTVYAQFESGVVKMKQVRDDAKTKIQENAEEAFDLVQNDFFGQMEDVMESERTIRTIANFGQFQTDFTREINKATQQIKNLKRQKIDTTELEALLSQVKEKGAEVKALFKVKPFEVEAVIDALGEIENVGQEFDDQIAELTSMETAMPWEKGTQQFQQIQVSPTLDKMIPREKTVTNNNGEKQTCNVNGVEKSGPCDQYQQ